MEQIYAAFLNKECSAIIINKFIPKLGDPGSFLIPCTFANWVECLALVDLSASINLMPYSLYTSQSVNTLKPTRMSIRLANHTFQYPMGVAKNMLVQVGKFVFSVDFLILEMEEDNKVPMILGRPFLHTADAIIRVKKQRTRPRMMEEELDALLNDYDPFLSTSEKINETSLDKEFEEFLAIDNQYFYQDPPTDLELKPLPKHLQYAFLEKDSLLPVVISALLKEDEKKRLVSILKNHKDAFSWKIYDIPGISPSFCKHKINFEDDAKPVIQRQRRLNPNTKEVMKKEIIKLLDADIIYPIEDSSWVSPIHCVPKKGGMNIGTNKKNELVPTRTVTSWRVCIDYRKLNESTQKDHFQSNLPIKKRPYLSVYMEPTPTSICLCLCNAPATFQSWEKCHFMVTEGIVLGHKVSSAGLEVDKAKIDAFKMLKEKLTNAPITVSPDWSPPFNLMCDTRDFDVGAVLGQYEEFDIKIKIKKAAKNVAADHLSRLENPNLEKFMEEDIDHNFPDETLMYISTEEEITWFPNFANYLV
ncbi:reverse transcriptase domain-containing protein [Tanacetum coccineum]